MAWISQQFQESKKGMSKKINRAYSVSNVLSKKFDLLEFENEWLASLGKPDKAFNCTLWGNRTNGKTAFAIAWGKYLTKFGRVAYNSLEEGLSHTVKMAIARNHMEGLDHSFTLLDKEPFMDMWQRMLKPKSPQFIFIDSIQTAKVSKAQAFEFIDQMKEKKKSVIWVSQAKGIEPKGSLADDIAYISDLKLWVEGFTMFPDGRLNGGGEPYIIEPVRAAKYWKKIK